MGGCFSKKKKKKKKKKDDPSSSPRDRGGGGRKGQKTAAAATSRDPPPTESPQEEKVKEVLSETPKITRQNSKRDSDRGCCGRDRSQVSEEFSAASTTLTETAREAEDDEEGEAEEIEMEKMRPAVTRSRSPAKLQKKINRSDFIVKDAHRPAVAAGKREIRGGVDVGCPGARSSPSPASGRARYKGNAVTRNRVSPAAPAGDGHNNNSNNYYYYKRSDTGERSLSPVMKRSVSAAPTMNQHQCRANTNLSATASTTATRANVNGRFSPPPRARAVHLEKARRGKDGNNAGSGGDGNGLEGKEETLENPLVSMECFIFL